MTTPTINTLPQRFARNADLATLVNILKTQHAQKVDLVVPASQIRAHEGTLQFENLPVQFNENGVTDVNGFYTLTSMANRQLGDKFGIPSRYMQRLQAEHKWLWDENVNGWARFPGEDRKFLVRMLWGQDAGDTTQGVVRAILSDSYAAKDNLDTVMALLKGVREAGLDGSNIASADLTDDRLFLRVAAPEISVMAPELLAGYRSPFSGASGADNPVVYAGLRFSNSETGGGALNVTPELKIQVCSNGLTITKDAMRSVHLGGKLAEGTIQWQKDTLDAEDTLVTRKVRDAVKSFLTVEYVQAAVDSITEVASVKLSKPMDTIELVAKELKYSQDETDTLLNHFLAGGQVTAGGVLQAVTSMCQTIEDAERSNDVQDSAFRAMALAAR